MLFAGKTGLGAAAWARLGAVQSAEPAAPVFWVWAENLDAYHLWLAVQTQWRVGMSGPSGLDYASIRAKPVFRAITPRDRREALLGDVEAMEGAWLAERARQHQQPAAPRGLSGDGY